MDAWVSAIIEVLWRNGLAVVPLAVLVSGICRWVPSRPATRHTLWVLVLLWFVVPPVLPDLNVDTQVDRADRLAASAPPQLSAVSPGELASTEEDARSANDESLAFPGIIGTDNAGPEPTEPGGAAENWTIARAELVSTDWFAASLETAGRLSNPPDAPHAKSRSRSNVALRQYEESASRSDEHHDRGPDVALGRASGPVVEVSSLTFEMRFEIDEQPTEKTRSTPRSQSDRRSQRLRVASAGFATDETEASTAYDERLTSAAANPTAGSVSSNEGGWRAWLAGLAAVRDATGRIPPMPVGVWALGMVALVSWRAHCFVRFHRRIAHGVPAPASTIGLVNEAARAIGLRRVPETWMVDDCLSPMLWCGRKARMLLPVQLWSQLDQASRRAVIYHELAHLRRGDHWVRRIESVVHTLCWWHPVVWWVRIRIHEEAELCCDAWVTWLLPASRRTYAETLLKARQYISNQPESVPALGIGITTRRTKRFARRLTMVMTESVVPKGSAWGVALAACVVLLAGWVATPARSAPPKSDAVLAEVDVTADAVLADDVVVDVSPSVAEKLEELRQALKSEDAQVRRKAVTRAIEIGAAAGPSLRLALSDHDASVRHRAADVLYDLGVKASPSPTPESDFYITPRPSLAPDVGGFSGFRVQARPHLAPVQPGISGALAHGHAVPVPAPPIAPHLAPTLYPAPTLPTAPHLAPTPHPAPVPHIAPTPHADPYLHIAPTPHADPYRHIAPTPHPDPRLHITPTPHAPHVAHLHVDHDASPQIALGSNPGEESNTYEEHVARRRTWQSTERDDRIILRSYRLPKGKLGALTRLMVRGDVPIHVQPHDDRIDVRATEAQHAAFKGFLDIIDPGENHVGAKQGEPCSSKVERPRVLQGQAIQQSQNVRRQAERAVKRTREARARRERQRVRQRGGDARVSAKRDRDRAQRARDRAARERGERRKKDPCAEEGGAAAKALDRLTRAAAKADEQAMREFNRVHEHARREAMQGAERAQRAAMKALEQAMLEAQDALERAEKDASRAIEEVVEQAIRAAQQDVRESLDELKDATKGQSNAAHDHDHDADAGHDDDHDAENNDDPDDDDDSGADESEEGEGGAVSATV